VNLAVHAITENPGRRRRDEETEKKKTEKSS
jgi:hypothetical protein